MTYPHLPACSPNSRKAVYCVHVQQEQTPNAAARPFIGVSYVRDYNGGIWKFDHAAMNTRDFRKMALSMEGAEEGAHMGSPDFRIGRRIFATLASQSQGYGNLMLTPEQQAAFVEEQPEVFSPVPGGWGRMCATHIRLGAASRDRDVKDGCGAYSVAIAGGDGDRIREKQGSRHEKAV